MRRHDAARLPVLGCYPVPLVGDLGLDGQTSATFTHRLRGVGEEVDEDVRELLGDALYGRNVTERVSHLRCERVTKADWRPHGVSFATNHG